MCERNAFYIQASCLCLEADSLRDSEQSAANITIYQVSLSHNIHMRQIVAVGLIMSNINAVMSLDG